jgi:tetratricopeptide (TPR) repeat protein
MDDLSTALRYHRRGQLQLAARHYQTILAASPDHPEALHLLGVLAHQVGNPSRAIELIGRAIQLQPGVATFYANLGEVHRVLGQLGDAAGCCRMALQVQPESPDTINCLGLVLLAQGQTEGAIGHFREALRLRPNFPLACNNLGNALRLAGDEKAALEHFRQAVQLDPNLAEGHSNLGQLLLEHKHLDEALAHLREAVRLRPDFAEAHSNLGNVLREMSRPEEALASYLVALRLSPALGMIHNNIAQALQEAGRLEEAITWYQRALQLEPGSARIHCNLASLLMEQEKYEEAVGRYEVARQVDPSHAPTLNGLGWARHEQGRYDEALTLYQEAIRLDPGLSAAHCNLGTVREELSDFAGAEASFRAALQHDVRLPGALACLATMLRSKLPDADLAAMQALLNDPYLSPGQHGTLHFGLAQVFDAREDFTSAATHLEQANRIAVLEWNKRGQGYDPAKHTQFVNHVMDVFTPVFFDKHCQAGHDTGRPVFIVGLPRSGTTLTEQVLASHSGAFGAGELRFGRDGFEMLAEGGDEEKIFAALGTLDAATINRIAGAHLSRLVELSPTADRVVDKMPDNYLYLGLLAALFPKAKFIHCRRDLRDIAVSCWMTNFRHIRWANDPDHIAARLAEHQRIMAHWKRALPVPVLEVDYEETVADLEGVARRLVDWCGLEWEAGCLAFHESKRPVRTASVRQVRQPIYKRSVARWKHYEKALGSLFDALEPLQAGAELPS